MQDANSAELTAFLRALELSGEFVRDCIGPRDIAMVEAAWAIPDTAVSSYGWVMQLTDGRRVYLEYTLDDARTANAVEEIKLIDLRADQAFPMLEDDAGVSWYWPDFINRHLGLTGPSLH